MLASRRVPQYLRHLIDISAVEAEKVIADLLARRRRRLHRENRELKEQLREARERWRAAEAENVELKRQLAIRDGEQKSQKQ